MDAIDAATNIVNKIALIKSLVKRIEEPDVREEFGSYSKNSYILHGTQPGLRLQ
jgi:hypothetical protein